MRSRMIPTLVVTLTVLAGASSALAHEGHGVAAREGTVLHFILEPIHLPLLLTALVALILTSRWVFGKLPKRVPRGRRR